MTAPAVLKFALGAALTAAVLSFGWWASRLGLPSDLPDGAALRAWFDGLGPWGPVAVIATMIAAILVSPLPSAPIALASGAIYGHFWGALYVLAGSEIGALAAFGIARFLGYDLMRKWLGAHLTRGLAGSQNLLTLTVFVSRLVPFISFDIVSYAAGMTALSVWRFAAATFVGILPASFLLAHFGSELAAEEMDRILIAVFVIGLFAAAPVAAKLHADFRRRRR